MYAEFKTSLNAQNRINNKLAHLYLFTDYYDRTWKLSLNLESYEVMHGLSRIVLLLPDKIATAIEINKEDLPEPDDGTFLIQLVVNLVKFYQDQQSRWDRRLHRLGDNDDIIVSRMEELEIETEENFG